MKIAARNRKSEILSFDSIRTSWDWTSNPSVKSRWISSKCRRMNHGPWTRDSALGSQDIGFGSCPAPHVQVKVDDLSTPPLWHSDVVPPA